MLLVRVLLLVAFSSWICLFPKMMMAMQEMAEMMLAGDTLLAVVKVTRKKPSTTVTLLATFNRACWMGLNMLKITVMLMMLYVAWNKPKPSSMRWYLESRETMLIIMLLVATNLNVDKYIHGRRKTNKPTGKC